VSEGLTYWTCIRHPVIRTQYLLCLAVTNKLLFPHNGMEGTKFIASQAKSIYHYKSLRSYWTCIRHPVIRTQYLLCLTVTNKLKRIPTSANLFDAPLFAPVLFNDCISHTHASGLPRSCPRCIEWPWSTYLKWRIFGYCPFDCRGGTEEDHRKCLNCYSRGRDSKPMLPKDKAQSTTLSTPGFTFYDCTKQH